MCKLINTHTRTHLCRVWSEVFVISIIIPPWEDQCEWHRMTRMTGQDCAVMCKLINRGFAKKGYNPLFLRQKGAHLEND